ncbi:uncharacterized protein LOC129871038 isoform X2 [Solanum dulcamara]|uniref:uncharacterized protein LOC129871038 isoform X2 n=1 Tax=Solanum dulcamara TaxID=45834 RepID=UPI002485DDDB|nr:uncharacterized protein LOC129871038 isoform X2 [Solanum dulcamara]
MAKFIEDKKNKNGDLFINLVSNEPSRNDQGPARDVPLGDDLGLHTYIPEEDQAGAATNIPQGKSSKEPPRNDAQGQGLVVIIGNNTQNQEEENTIAQQQGQGLNESIGNSQEQKQKQQEENNDDDYFQPLPKGFVPEQRSKNSRPPGQRPAPKPKTG